MNPDDFGPSTYPPTGTGTSATPSAPTLARRLAFSAGGVCYRLELSSTGAGDGIPPTTTEAADLLGFADVILSYCRGALTSWDSDPSSRPELYLIYLHRARSYAVSARNLLASAGPAPGSSENPDTPSPGMLTPTVD